MIQSSLTTKSVATALHLSPSAVVITGTLLVLKVVVWNSWKQQNTARRAAEAKQAELAQRLADLEHQQQSQPVQAPPTTKTTAQQATGKNDLFEQLINENIAIREAIHA